jgi:hypothetical protein
MKTEKQYCGLKACNQMIRKIIYRCVTAAQERAFHPTMQIYLAGIMGSNPAGGMDVCLL